MTTGPRDQTILDYQGDKRDPSTLEYRVGVAYAVAAYMGLVPAGIAVLGLTFGGVLPYQDLKVMLCGSVITGALFGLMGSFLGARWGLWALPGFLALLIFVLFVNGLRL